MNVQDIEVTTLRGERTTFGKLSGGKVALVVNVASRCGLAPQYEQLEELQRTMEIYKAIPFRYLTSKQAAKPIASRIRP